MISKILNFLKFLSGNLIGLIIGLAVAILLIIVLQATLFKNNGINNFLCVIICILFSIAGAFVQGKFFSEKLGDVPEPTEVIAEVDKNIQEGWDNTNGGFTFSEILESQNDDNCPIIDDQIIDLKCYDFGDYVVFSFFENNNYQNVSFVKSQNGLVVDGLMNVYADYNDYFSVFYPSFCRWNFDLDSFKWLDSRILDIAYRRENSLVASYFDNLISLSSGNASFLKSYDFAHANVKEARNNAILKAAELSGQNVVDNFIKFKNNVELIGTANSSMVKINSFYNYLYQQIKVEEYNTSKIIDATNCLCVPIPQGIQNNYSIPENLREIYNNKLYYGVYKCDIAVNLTFLEGNKILQKSDYTETYFEKIAEDEEEQDLIVVEEITPNYYFSKLKINFKNLKNNSFTGVDLLKTPIKISFNCQELSLTKKVEIDSFNDLTNGVECVLSSNVIWTYKIDSESLIFEDFQGSFKLKDNSNNITFDYYYLNGSILLSVGLNPVSTVNLANVDLATNPVKIILTNDKNTYQFVFDSNDLLDKCKSLVVELGTYNYQILSNQLIFASVEGQLTVTSVDRTMLFNYVVGAEEEHSLILEYDSAGPSLSVEEQTRGYLSFQFRSSDSEFSVADVTSKLGSDTITYSSLNFDILVYDLTDDRLLHSYSYVIHDKFSAHEPYSFDFYFNDELTFDSDNCGRLGLQLRISTPSGLNPSFVVSSGLDMLCFEKNEPVSYDYLSYKFSFKTRLKPLPGV